MREHQLYWVGQKAFIQKGEDILILHDPEEGLDFPGGRVEEGEEDLALSLKREVLEETGLEIEVGQPFAVWQRVFPVGHKNEGKIVCLIAYRCDCISGNVTTSHEHDNFKWVNESNYRGVNDGTQFFEILEKYFENK